MARGSLVSSRPTGGLYQGSEQQQQQISKAASVIRAQRDILRLSSETTFSDTPESLCNGNSSLRSSSNLTALYSVRCAERVLQGRRYTSADGIRLDNRLLF